MTLQKSEHVRCRSLSDACSVPGVRGVPLPCWKWTVERVCKSWGAGGCEWPLCCGRWKQIKGGPNRSVYLYGEFVSANVAESWRDWSREAMEARGMTVVSERVNEVFVV